MKRDNLNTLKSTLLLVAFSGVFALTSCDQGPKDSKEIAEEMNEDKFSKATEEDAEYLVSAAEISLEEIELGQLAQKNSKMPQVIALGKMMVEEHSKALENLKILAGKKQITIPTTLTEDGRDAYDKLKDKFGEDFDKKYCDMMVKGHEDAIDKFEKASTDANDLDIQSWARELVITLKTHLTHSTECKEKCEQMKS